MLYTPPIRRVHDPVGRMLGILSPLGQDYKIHGLGLIEIGHWNPEFIFEMTDADKWADFDRMSEYGVCDSPVQFHEYHGALLEADRRRITVFFVHVAKDPENAGEGGGWRWHKWGPYIGDHLPTTEYLDDEAGFDDGVYTYHAYAWPT